MAVVVTFNMLNINAMNTQAGVFIGNNNQLAWDANGKLVMGMGEIMGINQLTPQGAFVYFDNDVVDEPIVQNQLKLGNTIQGA